MVKRIRLSVGRVDTSFPGVTAVQTIFSTFIRFNGRRIESKVLTCLH